MGSRSISQMRVSGMRAIRKALTAHVRRLPLLRRAWVVDPPVLHAGVHVRWTVHLRLRYVDAVCGRVREICETTPEIPFSSVESLERYCQSCVLMFVVGEYKRMVMACESSDPQVVAERSKLILEGGV